MKLRNGFVSNSSSSSFVIPLFKISGKQLVDIENHSEHTDDPWHITVNALTVEGYTDMDNFDMHEFLKNIGIEENVVEWERNKYENT